MNIHVYIFGDNIPKRIPFIIHGNLLTMPFAPRKEYKRVCNLLTLRNPIGSSRKCAMQQLKSLKNDIYRSPMRIINLCSAVYSTEIFPNSWEKFAENSAKGRQDEKKKLRAPSNFQKKSISFGVR